MRANPKLGEFVGTAYFRIRILVSFRYGPVIEFLKIFAGCRNVGKMKEQRFISPNKLGYFMTRGLTRFYKKANSFSLFCLFKDNMSWKNGLLVTIYTFVNINCKPWSDNF